MTNIPETGRTPRVQTRLVVIQILVLSLLGTLGGRLWYLQIRNGAEYQKEASGNHVQQVVQPAVRGSILDARGVPLADNETRLVVSASRTDLLKQKDDGKAVLTKLAGVLGLDPQDVMQKVRLCDAKTPQPCWNGSPYQPIPITDEATPRQALQIRERAEDFPGITAEPEAVRRYASPGKSNTARSSAISPRSPTTRSSRPRTPTRPSCAPTWSPLRPGAAVRQGAARQGRRHPLRGGQPRPRHRQGQVGRRRTRLQPRHQHRRRVQRVAEYELDKAMKAARQQFDKITGENYKADSGAVVVMEAKTGRIVAMASAPTYDPNVWVGGISAKDYKALTGKDSDYPLLNRAIQGQSAPGSTFKVVSTAAAVQAGYDFNGNYPCTSSYSVGGQVFKNFEGENFGPISLGRALEVSCDTVFYGLADSEWKKDGGINPKKGQPKDYFFKTAHQFGLGKETGVDLPGEVTGRVPDRQWKQDYWKANKDAWCKSGKKNGSYVEKIAYENCLEGNKMREGDEINYSIGQGDTLVTPIQEAVIYGAISNGGTMYTPTIGKAVVSADGKHVTEIKPKSHGKLPITKATRNMMDEALAGVATRGTAAWKFGGWPQDKIPLHAKTGTAEVYGKQTTSWLATYTKDYSVIMTIAQAGTGSRLR